jgi:hypothetical protein
MKNLNSKSVFDHIKHIKGEKTKDYFSTLSDKEKEVFNKYVILMGLSMDANLIDTIALISKYMDILPPEQFYKVCCEFTPKTLKYFPWVKADKKLNKDLINILSNHFKLSKREISDYIKLASIDDNIVLQIINICKMYGHTEEEVENHLKIL